MTDLRFRRLLTFTNAVSIRYGLFIRMRDARLIHQALRSNHA